MLGISTETPGRATARNPGGTGGETAAITAAKPLPRPAIPCCGIRTSGPIWQRPAIRFWRLPCGHRF